MRILHVITGLQKAAGTTTFVENVVHEQCALGHKVEVVTNSQSLDLSTAQPDVIHIHGLWSALLHRMSSYAWRHEIPVVWSTHGMTAPWSLHHKWWKKFLPWYLYQLPDLRSAALIHCTTDLEADWNRSLGFQNVFVAPLGTTLPTGRGGRPRPPAIDATTKDALVCDCGELGDRPLPRTLLYVGRIYPVKALDNAIRAIALMKNPITLRIVGPDQSGHMSELMSLCEQLGLAYTKPEENHTIVDLDLRPRPLIQFAGPKYDADLSAEYDNCDGLILVSHTENFGATVIDAMAHGKPVITSTNTPWKIVADKGCGWWVDNSPESLARAFTQMLDCTDAQLRAMGANGLVLVKQSYSWPAIAQNLISHYNEVSCG